MDEPVKQETILPGDSYEVMPCAECDKKTRHRILAESNVEWEYGPGCIVTTWAHYQIIQCQGCLTISFCEASECTEDEDYDYDTNERYLPTTRKFYPSRITGRAMMLEVNILPHGVRAVYEEAHRALCAELAMLAGFGIRAIVEAVCIDKEMVGRNLQEKIDALVTTGLITRDGAEILHSLRFMGNAAAHEMRAHAEIELNAAFDVIEYLLQGVYILPKLADKLPKRS